MATTGEKNTKKNKRGEMQARRLESTSVIEASQSHDEGQKVEKQTHMVKTVEKN